MEYLKNNGQGAVMGEFGGGVGGFTSFTNPERNFSGIAIEDLPEESAPAESSASSASPASAQTVRTQSKGKKANGSKTQSAQPQKADLPAAPKKKGKGHMAMKIGVGALVAIILYKLFMEKGK